MFSYREINDWQTGRSYVEVFLNSDEYSFKISESNGIFSLEVSPGEERLNEIYRIDNWDKVFYNFQVWVDRLEEEVLIEDKWQAFEKFIEENSLIKNTEILNDKFTLPEYVELKSKIEIMKSEILKIDLTSSQMILLGDKLDIILEQTQHLGKYDWRSLFVGTIMSIILQLSLSQEQGKEIWGIIKKIFTNYFLSFK